MAKIHKGIATGSGFAYKGKDLNFSRDVYDNFTDLLADEKKYGFPDGFKTVVKDAVTGSGDYYPNNSYNNATFIYKFVSDTDHMLNWHCVAYDNIDEYLWPADENDFKLGNISGITHKTESLRNSKYVWDTHGGYANLNEYALKSDVTTDLSNYVTNSALTTTLGSYAKLNNSANFSELTLNGTSVATTKSVSDTLAGYAKLNNPANFSALKIGNKDVATIETVTDAIDTAVSSVLRFKGGVSTNNDIPAANVPNTGDVYVVLSSFRSELFVFNSTSGEAIAKIVDLEVGDTLMCVNTKVTIGSVSKPSWTIVQANLTNTVSFSSSLIANRLVISDSTSTVKSLASGNNGQFLTLSGGKPDWGDLPLFNGKRNGLVQATSAENKGLFLRGDGNWAKPHDTTYDDATTSTRGLMTAADKIKLNGIEAGANKYVLHVATDSSLGGIKIGYTENAGEKKYKVQVSSDGKAFVYVPWTDTNTTYNDMNGATASSAGTHGLVPAPTAGQQGLFLCGNGTWAKPTDTVYTAGTGISIDGTTVSNTGVISVSKGATDDVILVTNGVNDPKPIIINNVGNANVAVHAKSASTATTAEKLTTVKAGNTNTPVYFEDGVPKSIGFTIEKSVPSNAVFTDTIYTLSRHVDDHAKISLTSVNGSDTITIDDVAHATSADSATNATHATSADSATNATNATNATTATKVSNVLEIENYNPTGELLVTDTYNGSSKKTINCITVEEINGLFHS